MDVNLTLGIPVVAVFFGVNIVISFLRLKATRNGNGAKDSILDDLKEGHKEFAACFKELNDSSIRSEAHLENMVRQLQNLNNKP